MKTVSKKPVAEKEVPKEGEQKDYPEIKPDFPLSEKDEVKKAEDKLREGAEAAKQL